MSKGISFASFASFDAVTLTAAADGDVHDLEGVAAFHGGQFALTDFSGGGYVTVQLKMSLDGVSWSGGASGVILQGVWYIAQTTAFPARYVRAAVTGWPADSTGVMTAWVGSA